MTGKEIKNAIEFLLAGSPARPGDYFPRTSGLGFIYDPARSQFDQVTELAVGDFDRGYDAIYITEGASELYAMACHLFFALMLVSIPQLTDGKLIFVAKNSKGEPLQSRMEAIAVPALETSDLLPPLGASIDVFGMVGSSTEAKLVEIKEWQAIMEHLKALPAAAATELPIVPTDARARGPRFIRLG